jgi:hypothetical protein
VPLLRRPLKLRMLAPWIALLLPFSIYCFGFRFQGGGDSTPAELLPISLLHGHGFDFREFVSGDLPYWYRAVRGKVVSNYPVLPGLLNVPLYSVAEIARVDLEAHHRFLSGLNASILAALSVLFLYLALKHVCRSETEALFFALAYAFGTTVWSVASRAMLQHGPSVFFLSITLWALLRGGSSVAWAGLALGLAVIGRPANVAIAVPLALYVLLHERRQFPAFAVAAIPPVLFHLWYANAYWGSPLSAAQAVSAANFGGNLGTGLAGLLVSPSRGLFVFSPFFLFAAAGAATAIRPAAARTPALTRFLIAAIMLDLLIYSRWTMWWGGHSFGYRLLTELAPLLTILLAVGWPRIAGNRALLWLFGLCLLLSFYAHFLGAVVAPSGFNNDIDLQPSRLWNVRNSELELSTRKLIRFVAPGWHVAETAEISSGTAALPPVWWRPDLNDDTIPGWIDGSLDGTSHQGPLEISGWARSKEGDVDVRVSIAPEGFVPPIERKPRPDVEAAMPQLGDCSRAGWRAVVEKPSAATAEHVLLIEMRSPSGRVRRLGPIRFRWKG